MAEEIVLFHSALGLRPAVHAFADRLREAGHTVHTPDSYDGEVFDKLDDGIVKRDSLGMPELIRRAQAAVANLPPNIVYAGFSLGAAPAEMLAATRPGARAAILMHGALGLADIGVDSWPPVPVQVHYARNDPWADVDEAQELEAAARKAGVAAEVHVYEGDGHLFQDAGTEYHDADAAQLMTERVVAFLAELDDEAGSS
jgi:dienelactone hydrolase